MINCHQRPFKNILSFEGFFSISLCSVCIYAYTCFHSRSINYNTNIEPCLLKPIPLTFPFILCFFFAKSQIFVSRFGVCIKKDRQEKKTTYTHTSQHAKEEVTINIFEENYYRIRRVHYYNIVHSITHTYVYT